MKCIFCTTDLGHSTKPEHILLNALGGRKTTKKAICSSCNEFFGRGPDQEFAESVREIRNQAQLFSGDGDPPPPITGPTVEGGRYDFARDGTPVFIPDQPFSVETHEVGVSIKISASNDEHADRLLTNAARKILKDTGLNGYPEAAIQAIKADIWKEARNTFSKPPSRSGRLNFGSDQSLRSMAKAALVLWTEHLGANKLEGSLYKALRAFCLRGEKPESFDWWVQLDARDLPCYPPEYGSHPNLIWVGSNWLGQVYGYFRLYNLAGWRFRLCEIGGVPNTSLCLISNPFIPSVWGIRADDQSILSHAWVSKASSGSMEKLTSRVAALGRHGQQIKFEHYLQKTIESALQRQGLSAWDEPTLNQSEEIKNFILNRLKVLIDGTHTEEGASNTTE